MHTKPRKVIISLRDMRFSVQTQQCKFLLLIIMNNLIVIQHFYQWKHIELHPLGGGCSKIFGII